MTTLEDLIEEHGEDFDRRSMVFGATLAVAALSQNAQGSEDEKRLTLELCRLTQEICELTAIQCVDAADSAAASECGMLVRRLLRALE